MLFGFPWAQEQQASLAGLRRGAGGRWAPTTLPCYQVCLSQGALHKNYLGCLLEVLSPGTHSKHTEWEVGPGYLHFNKLPR